MQSATYTNEFYNDAVEQQNFTDNQTHHHQHHHHQPQQSQSQTHQPNTGTMIPSQHSSSTNMQYWTSNTSQLSPNQLQYSAYHHHQSNESIYTMQSSTSSTDIYGQTHHTNYGTMNESQDIYQYSPYSGDLLQPEEIFQMDQPIRSANISTLNPSIATTQCK